MNVTPATTPSQPAGPPLPPATSNRSISSDFNTFLRMLTVQMQNQDPLNPVDSSDYAVQLATFSGVEQQVKTNDLLVALAGQIGTSGMAQMAAWVGKEARAAVAANFTGSPITVSPNPAFAADRVELVVRNSAGTEVQRLPLPLTAEPVQWAGVDASGTPFPHGNYSFQVVSHAGSEILLQEPAEIYSRIVEVRSQGGEIILMLQGNVPVLASEVSALREPV